MPDAGDSLSHYRLLTKIGEGGMGDVWKAVDTKLDREVAVKILPPVFAGDAERLARFKEEARAVAALNHPNIVTIHSVDESDGVHFLTMELVAGVTLADQIPQGGLGIREFLDFALPLTDAVHAAHKRGVTHRDLKPANVMITNQRLVKILDFGLAKVGGDDSPGASGGGRAETMTRTLTQDHHVRGTMPYMSPEQVQGKPLDHRTDIFSLGVIFYEMATGRRPFRGESSADVIAAILRDRPRPVTERNESLPRQLERIIRHAIEKDRERRFQTVQDMHNELTELRDEVVTGGVLETARVPAPEQVSGRKSLAVLPLDNMSGNPEQEFFADGLTDALITDLAKIRELKVISRTSAMRYKGTDKSMRDVARELGVGMVVEGSVMRVENYVRINAQLIDATTDEHLWAERYEREVVNVLALQSDVAQAIAAQIRVKLTDQEKARLASPGTVNPEAHEACLRGRHFWYKRTSADMKKGLEYFERAIRLDPGYAPAWAGVADSYLVDGGRYLGVTPAEAYDKAREAATEALRLDDDLAEAHNSLAGVMGDYDWDWQGAEREYRRAIELNPGYGAAYHWYADHLSRMGQYREALAAANSAKEIDPLSPMSGFTIAWVHFWGHRFEDAIAEARKVLELEPNYVAAWRVLGWAYEEEGKATAAIEAHLKAASLSKESPGFAGQLGRAYALAERTDEAREVLAGLEKRAGSVSSLDIAIVHAALGQSDEAFIWLTRACDEHAEHVPYLKVNPRVDSLRSDTRFDEVLRRLKLA